MSHTRPAAIRKGHSARLPGELQGHPIGGNDLLHLCVVDPVPAPRQHAQSTVAASPPIVSRSHGQRRKGHAMDGKYAFSWDLLGDLELGRPNLGNKTRLEVYPPYAVLLSRRPRGALRHRGDRRALLRGGQAGGLEFAAHFLSRAGDLGDFVTELQTVLREMSIGILRVEKADASGASLWSPCRRIWIAPACRSSASRLRLRRGLHRRAAGELHWSTLHRQGDRLLVHR